MRTRIFFTDCNKCKKRVKIVQTEIDPVGKCPECGTTNYKQIEIVHSSETTEGYHNKRKEEISKMDVSDFRE